MTKPVGRSPSFEIPHVTVVDSKGGGILRHARLTVHGELADHLGPERPEATFVATFELPVGLRDLVQSHGIPHVEVGRVNVDGVSSEWDRRIGDEAQIELWARYPLPEQDGSERFLLDVHLGKLARLLRLLGVDAAYANDAPDDELARSAAAEDRVLLTRDRGLLMRSAVPRGRWVRATDPERQAAEVLASFGLAGTVAPFTRCMDCNGVLEAADPGSVEVPPKVRALHTEYRRCADCGRVYWAGTHHAGLEQTVDRILEEGRRSM